MSTETIQSKEQKETSGDTTEYQYMHLSRRRGKEERQSIIKNLAGTLIKVTS